MASLRFTKLSSLLLLLLLCACAQAGKNSVGVTPPADSSTPVTVFTAPSSTVSVNADVDASVFYGPLSVVITQPADNSTVYQSPLVISGKADPGTVVSFNDEVILVDDSGMFILPVSLAPGMNMIEITASDFQNHQDFSYMTVFFETEP